MTKHDFSDLAPPAELLREWHDLWFAGPSAGSHHDLVATLAARWGAEQAAERLKGQWPTPITDRPPTEADGDEIQHVQVRVGDGWVLWDWGTTADRGWAWRHTPNWQPPAPPKLTPQQQEAMDALDHILKHSTTNLGEATIRKAIMGGEA